MYVHLIDSNIAGVIPQVQETQRVAGEGISKYSSASDEETALGLQNQ
jgi:hypothetical protein